MSGIHRFADFELHAAQRQLTRAGQALPIGGRAMDLLLLLAEQRHRTVSKRELIDHCWPDQAVEPNNLAVQIWALRRLLGEGVIATVPGRGYRLVAPTQMPPGPAPPQVVSAPPGDPAKGGLPAAGPGAGPVADPAPAPALPLLPPMFGRQAELRRVIDLLQQHRLVTLLGPPGVGKTRLAQAVVADQAGTGEPTLLVDLAAVAEGQQVDAAVRQALGLADGNRAQVDAAGWLGLMAGRRLLLVLDNCEHLSTAVAQLAGTMLARLPALRLLATSQRPLGLAVEQRLQLQPLALPAAPTPDAVRASPALQLLVARVQSLAPDFLLADAELPTAAALCRRLDGLPLAIELAAARVPALGLQGVLARLDGRLQLLTRGTGPQRHATMAAALAWSVSLLPEPAQALLAALGVCQGDVDVELALQLAPAFGLDDAAALDSLGQLADHCLVVTEIRSSIPSLRLLETVRAHALASLGARGMLDALRQRHAEAVCGLLSRNGLARERGEISDDLTLDGVRLMLPNIRAAMDWVLAVPARAPVGHSILADTWPAMLFMGQYHEAMGWMLALAPRLTADTPPRTAGYYLLGLGMFALRLPQLPPEQRHAQLQRSQALLDTLPRTEYAMAVRHALAHSACQLGQPHAALVAADAALALLQPGDRANYRAILSITRGIALALLGRQADAEAAHAQALPWCVPEGNGDLLFMLQCDLALLDHLLGRHATAAARYAGLTQAVTARGVHSHVAAPLWAGLLSSLLAAGDLAQARVAAAETWRHMAAVGQPLEGCLLHAWLLALEGQPQAAMQLLGAGDRQLRLARETRLVFEPAARARLLACLGDGAAATLGQHWRRHGETLTPDAVHALLAPSLVPAHAQMGSAVGTGSADQPAGAGIIPATPPALHLLLVDDHPLFREGLALALQQALPGVQVLGCGSTAEAQALLAARPGGIDLVLVDHRLAGGAIGLDWARQLRQAQPAVAVALMSGEDDASLPARARQAGLVAFLPKTLDVPTLARVLRALQAGDTWFPPAAARAPITPPTGLTERQHQIVQLAAQGANSKAIGQALGISPATVRNHFAQIFERLGARSRAHAVQLLQRADGPEPPSPG